MNDTREAPENQFREMAVLHLRMAEVTHDNLVAMKSKRMGEFAALETRQEFDLRMAQVHALLFVGEQLEALSLAPVKP